VTGAKTGGAALTSVTYAIETVSGTITANDFVQALTGSGTLSGDNYTVTVTVKKDSGFKEGVEIFKVAITATNAHGSVTVRTGNLTIDDVSFSQLTAGSTGIVKMYVGDQEVVTGVKNDEDIFKT
jgi:hypothetical protein